MSAYRDILRPEQRPLYDQAIGGAASILGRARGVRDSLTPEEAAERAYVPGGPSREEIAALIRQLRAETHTQPLQGAA
ncbi:hypothetical protein OG884_18280 [Streptosporangium sp. NBC_01755]|uniref:hypothetical protein n=1 Tax=Streptosporangium sp. NBC_01755 TaxID=2975949 RepID=UPI002DDA1639|nr:hypothetical protein [Streptosporangium sp. NBC_01755]WSD03754.1 hypothetical protein OG884_18280 [Streptosporangium sp. NBC_01755]